MVKITKNQDFNSLVIECVVVSLSRNESELYISADDRNGNGFKFGISTDHASEYYLGKKIELIIQEKDNLASNFHQLSELQSTDIDKFNDTSVVLKVISKKDSLILTPEIGVNLKGMVDFFRFDQEYSIILK